MKNKLFTVALSLICAVFCALCFTACDNLKPVENPTEIESITLDKTELTIEVGNEETLTATVTPSNAEATVSWSSSNEAVATVIDGKVTAVSLGEAKITAKTGNKTAECIVTVVADISSYKVTEEQWKNAFENFSTNFTSEVNQTPIDYYLHIVSDGVNIRTNEKQNDKSTESIIAKIDNEYYIFNFEDIWSRNKTTENLYNQAYNQYVLGVSNSITAFKDTYSSFTFSESKYTANSVTIGSLICENVEIVFQDDKLLSLTFQYENGLGTMTYTQIGTSVVEIPTEFTDVNETN